MNENKKPRLCEVLGVEPGEKFKSKMYPDKTYIVNEHGRFYQFDSDGYTDVWSEQLAMLINDPSLIVRIPQFTPDEMAVLRLMKKAGYKKLKGDWNLDFTMPLIVTAKENGAIQCETFLIQLLPTIKPGIEINLNELNLEDGE